MIKDVPQDNVSANIVILGAGGHGKEMAQLIKDINRVEYQWNLLGYLDDNPEKQGKSFNGFSVLGPTSLLQQDHFREVSVVCGIGDAKIKRRMIQSVQLLYPFLRFPVLIHPTASISDQTEIQGGTVICALSLVSTDVFIGEHVLINYGCTVGHDSRIDTFSSILPGANLAGNVTVHVAVEIGSNATLLPGVVVGKETIVGAGAVVTKSLPSNCTAVGVPAKPIKYHSVVF